MHLTHAVILLFLLLTSATSTLAHKLSDSYLHINMGEAGGHGRWEIALRDLEYAVGLDQDRDLAISWGEVKASSAAILSYAASHLTITVGTFKPDLLFGDILITKHTDGAYAVLPFSISSYPADGPLGVRYSLLFDLDDQHRGLLRLERNSDAQAHIFSPDSREAEFSGGRDAASFLLFVREGVWHIWAGVDHVLFLISLLIPAALVRRGGKWEPAEDLKFVFLRVVRIVTGFTIAHSITLTLAAMEIVTAPAGLIEPVIAISVVLAAMNNVFGWFREKTWLFAFGFGLIHGFGFAFVLSDLDIRGAALVSSLLGFNIGVELGQIAIVLVITPIAFALRHEPFYRRQFIHAGSIAVALVAATWMAERVFDFKLLPF